MSDVYKKITASDEEMSWSLSSLSEGRISLSNDGEVATHPRHRQQIDEEDEVSALQRRLQGSSIIAVRSEQNENKRRKLKSKVWDEFTKYKGEDGMDWAVCSLCKREFDGSSKKGTTHLKNHLERCHAKRKRAGGDIDKSTKTRDLADINEKSVIDLIKNSFDAKGMTTLQVDQEEKETGIVLRDQQNEKNGKKLKSKVWDEFTKYKGEDGKDWAKCSICEKEFDGSSKKGTTHLNNHLKRCRANYKRKGAATGGDEVKSVKTMPVEKPVNDSLDGVLETIRLHLLGESESGLSLPTSSNSTPPTYCSGSSSFSRSYSCLTDIFPLAENDSNDMASYNALRFAVTVGWVPRAQQSSHVLPVLVVL